MAYKKKFPNTQRHGNSKFDLEEEAKAFREWADKEDSLILRLFAAIRGYYDQSKLHEYAEQNENFHQAFNYARAVIGARREQLCMQGKLEKGMVQRYAGLYDNELKKYDLEMKKAENHGSQIILTRKMPFDDDTSKKD